MERIILPQKSSEKQDGYAQERFQTLKSDIQSEIQAKNRKKMVQRSRQLLSLLTEQQKSDRYHEEAEIVEMVQKMELETASSTQQNASNPIPKESTNSIMNIEKLHARSREKANEKIAERCAVQLRNQLMVQYQYLIGFPDDFSSSDYLVLPVPEGIRCIVVTKNLQTSSRNRHGAILHDNFKSHLPNGNQNGKFYGMFDCVFNVESQTYYILDVLLFKELNLAESSAEMRFFWISQHIEKVNQLGVVSEQNTFKFQVIPKYPCTKEGIHSAQTFFANQQKNELQQKQQQTLLFAHRDANYVPGIHPNLLLWKSPEELLYSIIPSNKVSCLLQCDKKSKLITSDKFVLHILTNEERERYQIIPNSLVLVSFNSIQITNAQRQILLEGQDEDESDSCETEFDRESVEDQLKEEKILFEGDQSIVESSINSSSNNVSVDQFEIVEQISKEKFFSSQISVRSDGFGYQPDSLSRLVFLSQAKTNSLVNFSLIC